MPIVRQVLSNIVSQSADFEFEIIVADSCSSDGTPEFAIGLGAKVISIQPADFGHGTTRNMLAEHARGEFLVFVVQDAVPDDSNWMSALVEACASDEQVAGSYSRQIPRQNGGPIERYLCSGTTPVAHNSRTQRLQTGLSLKSLSPQARFAVCLFQNASSCIRRSAWEETRFPETRYGEDIAWAKGVIEARKAIAYVPTSCVRHSHDRSALYCFRRAYADHFQACTLFDLCAIGLSGTLRSFAWSVKDSWQFIGGLDLGAAQRLMACTIAPVHLFARSIGTLLGSASARGALPAWVVARLEWYCRRGV